MTVITEHAHCILYIFHCSYEISVRSTPDIITYIIYLLKKSRDLADLCMSEYNVQYNMVFNTFYYIINVGLIRHCIIHMNKLFIISHVIKNQNSNFI